MNSKSFHNTLGMVTLLLAFNVAAQSESPDLTVDHAMSIDSLYEIPSIIGTEPGGVAWSRDSRKMAFLWNDLGGTFRDVWIYDSANGEKRQLSNHLTGNYAGTEHRGIGEVQWLGSQSQQLAYTLDGELYISDLQGESRKVDTVLHGIHQLASSDDGKHLSFVAVAEDESVLGRALWVLDLDQGNADKFRLLLNPGHSDSFVSSYHWGRDSRQVSFELRHMGDMSQREIHYYHNGEHKVDTVRRAFPGEPNVRFDVGVVNTRTGKSRLLPRQDDTYPIWNYGLSASGLKLFVNESDPYVKLHRIEMYDLAGDTRNTYYQERDPKHLRPDWKAAWAPDDDGLIILTDIDGYLHLYHQKTAAGKPLQLTSGRWEISEFAVSDTRREVYFVSNRDHAAQRQLHRVSLDTGALTPVTTGSEGTHHLSYAPDMLSAASVFSNDQTPPELYWINFEKLSSEQITLSHPAAFHSRDWADVRYVNFNSHVDGTPLIGRLSLPGNFDPRQRYPLIVGSVYSDSVRNQWGGRTAHPTWGLDQHLVSEGYILLNVNVRGSWGQGREHNQGLLHGYGNIDIDDLESGVRHLVAKGYADEARVGIWGSSYGGLMTMMSLFKKPGVYAAGIAGAPATNVAHAYPEQMWVAGPATGEDMPGRYEKQSPVYHSDGLEDPLMIIHGNRDQVVLYSDTIAVASRLIAQEKPFELVTLPGAGHGWDAELNDQRRFSFKKMVEFFNRYLKAAKE
ncbi:MAG: prolyl oligopeptidase family serine peptidase [Halioglobus sp.]